MNKHNGVAAEKYHRYILRMARAKRLLENLKKS